MTVIGKILTFLIFFMSLVFFGLALSINYLNKDPQSKNKETWYQVAKNLRENVVPAMRKDMDAKDVETKAFVQTIEKLKSELDTAKKAYDTELAQRRREADDAKAQAAATTREFQKYQDVATNMEAELKQRRDEATRLYDDLKKRDLAVADIQSLLTKMTNEKIQSQVAEATFRERLNVAVKQNQDLTRQLQDERQRTNERLQISGNAGDIRRPPPDDVRGVVKSVGADGLVSISIGSDAGLLKGHTLEVFRTEPRAEYLGTMQIMDVSPHEAVGKLLSPQFKRLVRPNDQVASKILPAR